MNAKPATIHSLRFGDAVIEYTVRRSSRRKKTVEISVAGGVAVVAAPMRTPNDEIREIVRKRGRWILDKLEAASQAPPAVRLITGETLLYLGRDLPLVIEDAAVRCPSALFDSTRLLVRVSCGLAGDERREWARAALVAWYKARAAEFLAESVSRWLPAMGRSEMPRVLVREQRSRWGSCSSDGTLRFSWRLVMLEPDLIDSVVVHELAHLDVMNHSPAFWEVVLRAMPDARARRKRLDEAGRRLPL